MAGERKKETFWERMNTHETMSITVELMGQTLYLSQDPNTEHLGTTVWDASIVLAKMFEKNVRKGEFSRPKLQGKRVLELGAGMGLGGIALAMMDVDITLTDTREVLPLLKRNCEVNLGVGKAKVEELDWMQPEQYSRLNPPFDLVIAADCIYHEHIVPHFHQTVMAMTTPKSTVVVVNELRSKSVHAAFMAAFTPTHTIKRMSASKLDETYQHPLIEVYVMKLKKGDSKKGAGTAEDGSTDAHVEGEDADDTNKQELGSREGTGTSISEQAGATDSAVEQLSSSVQALELQKPET